VGRSRTSGSCVGKRRCGDDEELCAVAQRSGAPPSGHLVGRRNGRSRDQDAQCARGGAATTHSCIFFATQAGGGRSRETLWKRALMFSPPENATEAGRWPATASEISRWISSRRVRDVRLQYGRGIASKSEQALSGGWQRAFFYRARGAMGRHGPSIRGGRAITTGHVCRAEPDPPHSAGARAEACARSFARPLLAVAGANAHQAAGRHFHIGGRRKIAVIDCVRIHEKNISYVGIRSSVAPMMVWTESVNYSDG